MDVSNDAIRLLEEDRDNQNKQIEAYEAATKQLLDLQRRAVERQDEAVDRQKQMTTVYFRSLVVGALLVVLLLALLSYILRLI